eukprot:CAMPEP_0197862592 /NCGR_PEP_ID=MMETSP1438-20131217/39466_1 /TAXON_ID=1461541 /ORGANISM="Pterosperma sp., Strain CCMP1384" /LENGTH=307 /DNA_ID=CAMNT_0043480197 /DNA_START=57 /DNA_END=980 /DNA_ORIENTATION=-
MSFIPYSERPDWSDVVPVAQNDGVNAVVSIDYKADYEEVMNYFRGIVALKEHSQRALDITKEVISRTGAHFTAWNYRWETLNAIGSDLWEELEYLFVMGQKYPKNYQIWHHRKLVVGKLGSSAAAKDLQFTSEVLNRDEKNYHAWSYRQWLVRTFDHWEGEEAYVDDMLAKDLRNNSAWNQRWFVLIRGGKEPERQALQRDTEMLILLPRIRHIPDNESSWSYGRALVKGCAKSTSALKALAEDILVSRPSCAQALAFLVDVGMEAANQDPASKSHTLELLQTLMTADPVRGRYWAWCGQQLCQQAS